jgi:hypothetical protein
MRLMAVLVMGMGRCSKSIKKDYCSFDRNHCDYCTIDKDHCDQEMFPFKHISQQDEVEKISLKNGNSYCEAELKC